MVWLLDIWNEILWKSSFKVQHQIFSPQLDLSFGPILRRWEEVCKNTGWWSQQEAPKKATLKTQIIQIYTLNLVWGLMSILLCRLVTIKSYNYITACINSRIMNNHEILTPMSSISNGKEESEAMGSKPTKYDNLLIKKRNLILP